MNYSKLNELDREVLIERLVNRELNDRQRADFLAAADQWEGGWKEIALAFVEDQVFDQSLNEIDDVSAQHHQPKLVEKKTAGFASTSSKRMSGWVTAASVLISLAGGLLIGNAISQSAGITGSAPSANAISANQPELNNLSDPAGGVDQNPISLANHSVLKVPVGEAGQFADIPMLNVSQFENSFEGLITEDIQNALYREGYRIQPTTSYIRGQLEDNREFVVPIHQLELQAIAQ